METETVHGIFTDMDQAAGDILNGRWLALCTAASSGYKQAFDVQAGILKDVKAAREAQIKSEEAFTYGMLEMVTSAVGGSLIGKYLIPFKGAASSTVEAVVDEASKDSMLSELLKDMTNEAAKEAGTGSLNWAREKVFDKLKGAEAKHEDVYKPVGTSPVKFWENLDLGMRRRFDALSSFFRLCKDHSQFFSIKTARLMKAGFERSAYCKDAPNPNKISSDDYICPMELGLWIAWGRSLDIEYWHRHSVETNPEVYTFAAILKELVDTLQVPPDQVSDVSWLQDRLAKSQQKVDAQYGWKPRPATQPRWLNPYRFIRYCKNSSNVSLWLRPLSQSLHPEGIHIATHKFARLH
jgi:hypothetical protein